MSSQLYRKRWDEIRSWPYQPSGSAEKMSPTILDGAEMQLSG